MKKESILTSIFIGLDFLPSVMVGFTKMLGNYRYLAIFKLVAYAICVFAIPVYWIGATIIVAAYRRIVLSK